MQYDRTNTITLFKKEKKTETSPVMTGKVNIEGVEYSVSLWSKKSNKDGSVFWSGKVSKFEKTQPETNITDEPLPF